MPDGARHDHTKAKIIQNKDGERDPKRDRVDTVQRDSVIDCACRKESSDQQRSQQWLIVEERKMACQVSDGAGSSPPKTASSMSRLWIAERCR